MNIDSANIVNVLPGSAAIEGLTTLLPGEGAVTEGFADALKMQLQFLTDVGTGTISPINTETPPLATEQVQVEVQKTADLLGNDLPVSYKVDDKDDVDATLSVVTDSLKYLEAGATAQPETPQVPLPVIADQPQLQAETEQQSKDDDTAQLAVVDDQEAQTLLAQRMMVLTQDQPQLQTPESEDSAASQATQAEVLSLLKSSSEIAKINADKQLNQVKSEQVQLKIPTTSESFSADLAQQEQNAATGKPAQTEQLTAVTSKSDQTEQLATEVTSKIEANVVGAASVNGQVDKIPADVKTEVPALTRPLSHPEWNKDLGERIVWMNNRAMPAAEINLNPQHLGPVSVRIDMNQDQASIVFTAQHAAVREAIEASLPKLREMLGEQQLNLVNVSIAQHGGSEQKQAQSQAQPQYVNQTNGEVAADGVDGNSVAEGERVVVSNGLLNMYA